MSKIYLFYVLYRIYLFIKTCNVLSTQELGDSHIFQVNDEESQNDVSSIVQDISTLSDYTYLKLNSCKSRWNSKHLGVFLKEIEDRYD